MEIERKFLIKKLPDELSQYPHDKIRQAYISTAPVIRVRQKNDQYILTLKSGGMLARQEVEMPLSEESFMHLLSKKDGIIIEKTRYKIPYGDHLTIELDLFEGVFDGFIMAEIEYASVEEAKESPLPDWFGVDVTYNKRFHNSYLCGLSEEEAHKFVAYSKDLGETAK